MSERYHGPICGACGSRRTGRVGETDFRLCHACGRTGRLVVNNMGAVVQILHDDALDGPRPLHGAVATLLTRAPGGLAAVQPSESTEAGRIGDSN